jgi:FkbM family methyltransferase
MAMVRHNGVNVALDAGANAGQYGEWLRAAGFTGRIVSFEPLGAAYAELRKKAERDGNWSAHCVALGAACGEAWINVAGNSYSSSLLPMREAHRRAAPDSAYVGRERVRLATLDSLVTLGAEDRALLKLDTQGYEDMVLEGARQALERVRLVVCELSLVELYAGQKEFGEMLALFRASGFRPAQFEREFADPATGYSLQVNGVFCREEAA